MFSLRCPCAVYHAKRIHCFVELIFLIFFFHLTLSNHYPLLCIKSKKNSRENRLYEVHVLIYVVCTCFFVFKRFFTFCHPILTFSSLRILLVKHTIKSYTNLWMSLKTLSVNIFRYLITSWFHNWWLTVKNAHKRHNFLCYRWTK